MTSTTNITTSSTTPIKGDRLSYGERRGTYLGWNHLDCYAVSEEGSDEVVFYAMTFAEVVEPEWMTEYPWECECGERHRSAASAIQCRKGYCPDDGRKATNVYTGEVITSAEFYGVPEVDEETQRQADAAFAQVAAAMRAAGVEGW